MRHQPWSPPQGEETEDMSDEHRVMPMYDVHALEQMLDENDLDSILETLQQLCHERAEYELYRGSRRKLVELDKCSEVCRDALKALREAK